MALLVLFAITWVFLDLTSGHDALVEENILGCQENSEML